MANYDVLFKVVGKGSFETPLARFEDASFTADAKTFYIVGSDLYLGTTKLSNGADLADAVSNIATNAGDIANIKTTLTKLENTEETPNSIRAIVKGYLDALKAADVEYKAADGEDPAVSVKDALDDLYTAVGDGGSVSSQIEAEINKLNATVTQDAGTDGVAASVTETNGKLTAVSVSIAANTYDAHGAAAAVLGEEDDAATANTVYGAKAAAAAAKSAADAAQSDIDALETLVGTGFGTKEVEGETVNKTVKEYIDEAKSAATYDDTALAAKVQANEDAITLLNKTDGTVGSVKKTVDDAIAEVVANAPEDLDTLKEISDWISGHETDAAGMNSAIQANKAAIGTAATPAQGDPSDEDYVPAAAATGLYKVIEDADKGLSDRITALEGKAGTDSVEDQITAAIEKLDTKNDVVVATVDETTGETTISGSVKELDGVVAKGDGTDVVFKKVARTGAAEDVAVTDADGYFTATNVESVLAEIGQKLTWQEI